MRLTLAGLSVEQAHVFLSAVEGSRVPKRNKLPHELPYIFVGADEHGIDRDPRALPTLQDGEESVSRFVISDATYREL